MNSKEKIFKYIDYKGFTMYKFEKIVGLSGGTLKSGKEFTVDKMKAIRDKCPDLNMNWLLFDEGNMLLEGENIVMEAYEKYHKTCPKCQILEKELKHCNELLEAKKETVEILKSQLDPNRNSKVG